MTQSCKESVPLKTQRNLKCYGRASCSSMTSNKTCPTQDILTKSATPGQEMLANAADITETYTKLYRNRKVSWSGYRQWEDNRSLLYLLSASWAVKSISLQSPGLPLLSKARIPVTTPWPAHTNCQKISHKACLGMKLLFISQQHHIYSSTRLYNRKAKLGRAGRHKEGDGNDLPYFNAIFENSL